jgi:PAT family beta-lactamase induction signal transducer AmpG
LDEAIKQNGAPPASKPHPPFWVITTYFAEGFPYSLVRQISTVYFKDHGASLQAIGLTSLYGLPWVLKLLWAPLADAYETKRKWLLSAEGALVAAVLVMAGVSAMDRSLSAGSVVFLLIAFLAATHDIAIDGYYLEALDRKRQAAFVGYQAMAYRLALIAGGGGIVAFSGLTSWPGGFLLAAAVLLGLLFFHCSFLPRTESRKRAFGELLRAMAQGKVLVAGLAALVLAAVAVTAWRSFSAKEALAPFRPAIDKLGIPGLITLLLFLALLVLLAALPRLKQKMESSGSVYGRAFLDWLDQPRIGVVLAFLCTYRTGESFLLAMVYPLLKDIGITRTQYGVIYGTFGIAASIIGSILGGHLIGKFGLRKVIWPLMLAQNVPHLLYMALAWRYAALVGHPDLGAADPYLASCFVVLEAFGAGMGTAAFMVFIQRTCKASFKAAHFSIATSIMNVSSTLAGVLSGFLAASLGYPAFFAFTFLVTVPSMAFVPFLPHLRLEVRK